LTASAISSGYFNILISSFATHSTGIEVCHELAEIVFVCACIECPYVYADSSLRGAMHRPAWISRYVLVIPNLNRWLSLSAVEKACISCH